MPDDTSTPPWWTDDEHGDPWAQPDVAEGTILDAEPADDFEAEWEAAKPAAELSPRELSARRLTTIAALEKWLARLKAQEKSDGAWTRAGQKETVALPTGEELGNTRTDPVAGGWKVKDAGKWLAYVSKTQPDQVVEVTTAAVDPTWQARVLAALTAGKPEGGPWLDLDTGEERDTPPAAAGLEYVPAGYKIVTTAHKGAPEAVAKYMATVVPQLGLPELEAGK